jgi:hypothetical protein
MKEEEKGQASKKAGQLFTAKLAQTAPKKEKRESRCVLASGSHPGRAQSDLYTALKGPESIRLS